MDTSSTQNRADLPALVIDPSTLTELPHTIMLDAQHTCWVTIDKLPSDLSQDAQDRFDELFALHPKERSKILMISANESQYEEVDARRYYQSYGATPELNPELKKTSYMFGGFQKPEQDADHEMDYYSHDPYDNTHKVAECSTQPVPPAFEPLFHYMRTRRPYNQCVVTWYENGLDMIPFHSDWDLGMPCDADIATVTLTRNHDKSIPSREFVIKAIGTQAAMHTGREVHPLYRRVTIKTTHGSIIVMGGQTQKKFRHCVPKAGAVTEPRISLSLRQFEVSSGASTTSSTAAVTEQETSVQTFAQEQQMVQ